ncbi:MAG: hypothetical protein OJF51_000020 [Nitrospira sp.]|nr:MAG: hypothetical protein OJF51_000020 [Nitrospira sp.]
MVRCRLRAQPVCIPFRIIMTLQPPLAGSHKVVRLTDIDQQEGSS